MTGKPGAGVPVGVLARLRCRMQLGKCSCLMFGFSSSDRGGGGGGSGGGGSSSRQGYCT